MNDNVFYITIEIVVRNEGKDRYYNPYKKVVDVFREKFVGSLEQAKEKVNNTINSGDGFLRRGEIERMRNGLCGLYFSRVYSWK